MDLAWRYLIMVQVVERNGHDAFYGCIPDFGIETFEAVDPGNVSQEYMFHLKLRRMIGEALSVHRAEKKELPPIREAKFLRYNTSPTLDDEGSDSGSQMVSTTLAAEMLGVHPDTIRSLFDSGVLKGSLTKGGQRTISIASIHEEKVRMTQRVEFRKLELRAKKKNSQRKQKRVQKQKKESLERFNRNVAELSKA